MKKLAIIAALALQVGCLNADKSALRESMYQGTATIRQQHKDWASKLVRQPDGTDKRAELPQLSPFEYQEVLKTHQDFDDLVNKDRTRDSGGK